MRPVRPMVVRMLQSKPLRSALDLCFHRIRVLLLSNKYLERGRLHCPVLLVDLPLGLDHRTTILLGRLGLSSQDRMPATQHRPI
jgi:hypothetical protein